LLLAALLAVGGIGRTTAGAARQAGPIDPAECLVAPRTPEELTALLAGDGPDDYGAGPTTLAALDDPAAVAGIAATVREAMACSAAGDRLRLLALYTDDGLRSQPADQREELLDWLAQGPPPPEAVEGGWATAAEVLDAWILPDGRVYALFLLGFVVEGEDGLEVAVEAGRAIFTQVGERWLIDEVLQDGAYGSFGDILVWEPGMGATTSEAMVPTAALTPATGVGVVQVLVRGADDEPVGGACVALHGAAGMYEVCDDGAGDVDITPGQIEIEGVAAGDYTLVETRSPDGARLAEPVELRVAAGQFSSVELGRSVGPEPTPPATPGA
jgi:hypothetical protein